MGRTVLHVHTIQCDGCVNMIETTIKKKFGESTQVHIDKDIKEVQVAGGEEVNDSSVKEVISSVGHKAEICGEAKRGMCTAGARCTCGASCNCTEQCRCGSHEGPCSKEGSGTCPAKAGNCTCEACQSGLECRCAHCGTNKEEIKESGSKTCPAGDQCTCEDCRCGKECHCSGCPGASEKGDSILS